MKLLLDTHVFLHMTGSPEVLPAGVRALLEDEIHELLLSLVSPWEMQIKIGLGKLAVARPVRELVEFEAQRGAVSLLPIALSHIDALSRLPEYHRDPFDRLLIAQAIEEGLTLVTADETIRRYPVPTVWD